VRFFAAHWVPESIAWALEASDHEVLRLRNQMARDGDRLREALPEAWHQPSV